MWEKNEQLRIELEKERMQLDSKRSGEDIRFRCLDFVRKEDKSVDETISDAKKLIDFIAKY